MWEFCVISGYFNIDLIETIKGERTLSFINEFSSPHFLVKIIIATPVTTRTSTCTAHIWTSSLITVKSGVLLTDISDPIFVVLPSTVNSRPLAEVKFRCHKQVNIDMFRQAVSEIVNSFLRYDGINVMFGVNFFVINCTMYTTEHVL